MTGRKQRAKIAALIGSTAAAIALQWVSPAVSQAQDPVCAAGMYWNVVVLECLPYGVNPVVGPAGPIGVGGVVGPVGPGPVGPGPIGPGPVGPGPIGPGPR